MVNYGILFGGRSLEHEISIITAFQVYEALKNEVNVVMLYIDKDNCLYDASNVSLNNFKEGKVKHLKKASFVSKGIKIRRKMYLLDIVIIATHGASGEDGTAKALLDFYNIPSLGSSIFSSSLCMNKAYTNDYLKTHGINVVEGICYTFDDYLDGKQVNFYPCIIKPSTGGSSVGISISKNETNLKMALLESFEYNRELFIEKYLENVVEYSLAVSSYTTSNVMKVLCKNKIFSYEMKYENDIKENLVFEHDETIISNIKAIGRKVYSLVKACGIIRIDFLVNDDIIYVNEINTIPGGLSLGMFNDGKKVLKYEINKAMTNYRKESLVRKTLNINLLNLKTVKK